MGDLVSIEELHELKEVMEDEFELLLSMFIGDSGKLLKTIKLAYEQGNSESLRIASHTLKGSSSNMCAIKVSAICKKIEEKARNNKSQDIALLIKNLDTAYTQTLEVLKEC